MMSMDKYLCIFSHQMEAIVFIILQMFFLEGCILGDLFSKLLNVKENLSVLKILLVCSVFSSIHFNNLLGIKAKPVNVNRRVSKLGNITWGISSDIPQFWLHHVICLDQLCAHKIFDGL